MACLDGLAGTLPSCGALAFPPAPTQRSPVSPTCAFLATHCSIFALRCVSGSATPARQPAYYSHSSRISVALHRHTRQAICTPPRETAFFVRNENYNNQICHPFANSVYKEYQSLSFQYSCTAGIQVSDGPCGAKSKPLAHTRPARHGIMKSSRDRDGWLWGSRPGQRLLSASNPAERSMGDLGQGGPVSRIASLPPGMGPPATPYPQPWRSVARPDTASPYAPGHGAFCKANRRDCLKARSNGASGRQALQTASSQTARTLRQRTHTAGTQDAV